MLIVLAALSLIGQTAPDQSSDAPYQPPADLPERVAHAAWMSEHGFELADEDHDGRLSRDEYRSMGWLVYGHYDRNADGGLDRGEFADMRCGGLGPDRPGHQPYRTWCLNSADQAFRRLGRGGPVTPRRIQGEADDAFRFSDSNHDGFVTHEEELAAARRARGR